MEALLFLVGLILAALPVVLVVLLVTAYVRSRRIGELLERVERLERRLRRLENRAAPALEVVEEAVPVAAAERVRSVPLPPAERATPPRPQPPRTHPASPSGNLEWWIGRRLGWLAVILFVFAAAFFLKYAFDNNWIGELGRVAIGAVIGAGLCLAGLRCHLKQSRILGEICTAAGVATLYLSTYAAFGFYSLLTRQEGGAFLAVLMALAALLAMAYNSPAVALLALAGGLLTPVLLVSEQDQYISLFLYLAVLAAAAVGLAWLRPRWPALRTVALLGVYGLYWAWFSGNYHPEKQTAALVFLVFVFGLFLASGLLAAWRRRGGWEDLLVAAINPFLFFAAAYRLLDEDFHQWMGALAVLIALVCTAAAVVVARWREDDPLQRFAWVAAGLAFLAIAVPLQVGSMKVGVAWVAPCWAVEGLALWWFGLRVGSRPARVFGVVLLVGAVVRLLTAEGLYTHHGPFIPVFNAYTLSGALTAAAVLGAAFAARRFAAKLEEGDVVVRYAAGLVGAALVWLLLSREVYDFCTLVLVPASPFGPAHWPPPGERLAQTALSAAWTAYAALLLWIGFRLDHALTRWAALAVFAVTVAKVFLYDLSGLDGLFRILAFLILSVVLAAAAWGYQKFQAYRRAAAPEDPTNE